MDLTQILNAVVLGIVEGITEFLPISSTGHLIIFNQWFNFGSGEAALRFAKLFDIVIQSGAILAVIIYFRKRIFPVYRFQGPEARRDIGGLWLKAVIGMLPAVAIGVVAKDFISATLMQPLVVAVALAFWGAFIIVIETRNARALKAGKAFRFDSVKDLTIPVVVAIGFIQCLGMIPGTSRSAATIIGAMILGASRLAAAEFSFFLAIPTLVGASGYLLLKELKDGLQLGGQEVLVLATGTLVSFLVAWAVVAFLMKFIQKHDFRGFGWYRIALGLVLAGLILAGVRLGA
jgi:undecaprenyl-diphosphatase